MSKNHLQLATHLRRMWRLRFPLLSFVIWMGCQAAHGQNAVVKLKIQSRNTGTVQAVVEWRGRTSDQTWKTQKTSKTGDFTLTLVPDTYDFATCGPQGYWFGLKEKQTVEPGMNEMPLTLEDPPTVNQPTSADHTVEGVVSEAGRSMGPGIKVCLLHTNTGCIVDRKKTDEAGAFKFTGIDHPKDYHADWTQKCAER